MWCKNGGCAKVSYCESTGQSSLVKGYSCSFIHDETWLDFNSMQTWKSVELIYPMAEGAYEHGSEYGFDVLDLGIIVRINGVSSMANYRVGLPKDDINDYIGSSDEAPPQNEVLVPFVVP